jgi:phosphoribosyl-AMP cyclohydrolase
VRDEEPDAVGVFAVGSYAQGSAAPSSDLDLQIVTLATPRVPFRTWFVGDLHVSAGAKSTDELRRVRSVPAGWSLGFAVDGPGVWVWSTAAAVAAQGDPPGFSHPPGEPGLEDFVEFAAKALRAGDPVRLRVAARGMGETAPVLLRDLNAPLTVRNRVEAVRAALELAVAPEGWAEDLAALLALVPADDARVRAAAERLARGVLAMLRERAPRVDPQPEIGRYLADGTLERHLGLA